MAPRPCPAGGPQALARGGVLVALCLPVPGTAVARRALRRWCFPCFPRPACCLLLGGLPGRWRLGHGPLGCWLLACRLFRQRSLGRLSLRCGARRRLPRLALGSVLELRGENLAAQRPGHKVYGLGG